MMHKQQPQRGSSLLYVILFLGIMFVISFSVAVLASRELVTTGVNQRSQRAFYAAESGLERALYSLSLDPVATEYGPFRDQKLTSDDDTATYAVAGGDAVSPGDPIGVDAIRVRLNEVFDTEEVFLFDPVNLGNDLFNGQTPVTVTIECITRSCKQYTLDKPGLEVTIMSFNKNDIGDFLASKAKSTPATRSLNLNVDESKIKIQKERYLDSSDSITLPQLTQLGARRYLLQIKALKFAENYRVHFDKRFAQTNAFPVESFGDVVDQQRRGIKITLDRNRRPVDVFDYVLLEEDSIEKFAR
ncbi:hypothetical protein ACFL2D_00430 [Patescibacteria group bacterium]